MSAWSPIPPGEPNTPLLAALVYIAHGWRVLPLHGVRDSAEGPACTCAAAPLCATPGAHLVDGLHLTDASSDASTITAWWHRHPHANVGFVTGRKSGVVAVTVDDDLVEARMQPLVEALLAAGGPIIRRTDRSAAQFLFAAPDVEVGGTDFTRGFDYSGAPSLVVAPPSRLALGAVEWSGGSPAALPALPVSFHEMLGAAREIDPAVLVAPRAEPEFLVPESTVAAPRVSTLEPVLLRIASVEPLAVDWLLSDRIPLGELTAVMGHPEGGKSVVLGDLAARVTTGGADPITGAAMQRGSVIIMGREEDPARSIRPRLEAAGADLSRVFLLNDVRETWGAERGIRVPHDIAVLEPVCREHDVRLVVIDPISDFLSRTDANAEQDVRRALLPLVQLARSARLAVVFIRHLSKREHANALHHGLGSVAFGAVARAGLLVEKSGEQRVLRTTKSSCCPPGVPPVGFKIVNLPAAHGAVPRVEWMGVVDDAEAHAPVSAMQRAEAFLLEVLANGPVSASEVLARSTGAGFSERTLREAKKRLGITSHKKAWTLPQGCNTATPEGGCSVADAARPGGETEGRDG